MHASETPTRILRDQHQNILKVADVLDRLLNTASDSTPIDYDAVGDCVKFIRLYADALHHGKEEDLLFARMGARGMPTQVGPIAVMLDDHKAGRAYIAGMGEARDADDPEAFARAGLSYVELMRDHIAKEDGVLFPMAESMLDDGGREQLLAAFRAFEHEGLGEGVHERMLALADGLAEHFGVALAAARGPATAGHGCCGHGGCP